MNPDLVPDRNCVRLIEPHHARHVLMPVVIGMFVKRLAIIGLSMRHDEHYHVDFAMPCQPF